MNGPKLKPIAVADWSVGIKGSGEMDARVTGDWSGGIHAGGGMDARVTPRLFTIEQ